LYKNAIVSHKLCFNDPTGALEEMKTPLWFISLTSKKYHMLAQ
jgi:hypothetical protein